MKATDISHFATSQLSLLSSELQAELAETTLLTATHAPPVLQRAGLAILNLHVSSQRTGLGGKTLLELGLDPAVGGGELPEHGLRVGDIVAVAEQPKGAERKREREGAEKRGVEGMCLCSCCAVFDVLGIQPRFISGFWESHATMKATPCGWLFFEDSRQTVHHAR